MFEKSQRLPRPSEILKKGRLLSEQKDHVKLGAVLEHFKHVKKVEVDGNGLKVHLNRRFTAPDLDAASAHLTWSGHIGAGMGPGDMELQAFSQGIRHNTVIVLTPRVSKPPTLTAADQAQWVYFFAKLGSR